jgi:hypothetical protein
VVRNEGLDGAADELLVFFVVGGKLVYLVFFSLVFVCENLCVITT